MGIARMVAAVGVVLVCQAAWGLFMQPQAAPVDRLAQNAAAYIAEHPDDPHGYYVLGRIHYLAWSLRRDRIPHYGHLGDGKPGVVDDHAVAMYQGVELQEEAARRVREEMKIDDPNTLDREQQQQYWQRVHEVTQQLRAANWTPPPPSQEKLDEHADAALKNLRLAVEKDGENGLYHLGLASFAEQYASRAAERKLAFADEAPDDEAAALKEWRQAALDHYARAFELTRQRDAALDHQPIKGIQSLVSFEAAVGYPRVAKELGDEAGDAELVDAMREHQKQLAELPMGPITPMVLSFEPHNALADLIDADAAVPFDMDGTGRPQRWSWPRATTGLLVWDPAGTGRITSGRQLFGSVTWWLMPRDGYHALDLLDDNRDGELAGSELHGLSLWFDRNGDGISDRGEVTPLRHLPIEAIATQCTSMDGHSPANHRGVRLTGGAWIPSYDWMAEPR